MGYYLSISDLIRDIEEQFIENYPSSLLVRSGLICRISCLS